MAKRKKKSAYNLDHYAALIMADDPATYGDFGEYEFSGTLADRVWEIVYNHAYEAASPYTPDDPARMWAALAPLRELAEREGFLGAVEEAWGEGLKAGADTRNPDDETEDEDDYISPNEDAYRIFLLYNPGSVEGAQGAWMAQTFDIAPVAYPDVSTAKLVAEHLLNEKQHVYDEARIYYGTLNRTMRLQREDKAPLWKKQLRVFVEKPKPMTALEAAAARKYNFWISPKGDIYGFEPWQHEQIMDALATHGIVSRGRSHPTKVGLFVPGVQMWDWFGLQTDARHTYPDGHHQPRNGLTQPQIDAVFDIVLAYRSTNPRFAKGLNDYMNEFVFVKNPADTGVRAVWTGWSCPSGPAALVDFLVDRGTEVSYPTFRKHVDIKTADFLEPWQRGLLPKDETVTFLRTELPHGERAWVMQHSGIEYAFVEPGVDFYRAAEVIEPLTEALEDEYGWASSWPRDAISATIAVLEAD